MADNLRETCGVDVDSELLELARKMKSTVGLGREGCSSRTSAAADEEIVVVVWWQWVWRLLLYSRRCCAVGPPQV